MHSSLRLFGRRKGACGSSLWKQSRDSSAEGGPLGWASPSCRGLGVTGAKGTLVQAMTGRGTDQAPSAPSPCCSDTAEWMETCVTEEPKSCEVEQPGGIHAASVPPPAGRLGVWGKLQAQTLCGLFLPFLVPEGMDGNDSALNWS